MIPSAIDLYNLEKNIAAKATKDIRAGIKNAIARTTHKKTGEALKLAGSRAVFKDQRLQRVTIKAPHYIFKQHYGFEGTKKNGINQRMAARDTINIALDQTNVLETLADAISNVRMEQVLSAINFNRPDNRKYIQV